jgi:tetratricopeptide (TPR) repeat protein
MMTRSLVLALTLAMLSGCAMLRRADRSDDFEQGSNLFNRGRFEAAIPYFESATREDPNFAEAYLYLGRSYISLSRWRDAIQPLRTAFRLAPKESQGEIMNLLIDAAFAAAFNDFQLGDRLRPPPGQSHQPFGNTL